MFWGQSFECLRQAQCTLSSCLSIHFFPKYTDIDRFSIYFPKFFARLTLKICPTYRLFNAALRAPPPPPPPPTPMGAANHLCFLYMQYSYSK